MMSVLSVAIFWVINASSGEKSCVQFSIPTGSEAGGEGGVLHRLKRFESIRNFKKSIFFIAFSESTIFRKYSGKIS